MEMPRGPLFRPEAVASRGQRVEGEVVLAQPARARLLTFLIFAVAAALALWLTLGSYARSETARGILKTRAGSAKMVAPRPGQVAELFVREGQRVVAGQRLAVIHTEPGGGRAGSPINESLEALERQMELAQERPRHIEQRVRSDRDRIAARLSGLRQQQVDLAGQIRLQEQVVSSSRDLFDRISSLLSRGFVSQVEVERRRQMLLAAQQELARLHQQSNALAAEARQLAADLARSEAEASADTADAQSAAQTLTQQGARLRGERAYTITAPFAGRVAALQAAIGRHAEPAVPLMEIVPENSTLVAHVYAPARAIGFVRPGQEVRLLYDAFPYQRFGSFGGRIVQVSRAVIDPRQLAEPLQFEEPVYRIEVVPDRQAVAAFGERHALQSGMVLTANIILDRRSFLDWLLAPLSAVTNRSGSAS